MTKIMENMLTLSLALFLFLTLALTLSRMIYLSQNVFWIASFGIGSCYHSVLFVLEYKSKKMRFILLILFNIEIVQWVYEKIFKNVTK